MTAEALKLTIKALQFTERMRMRMLNNDNDKYLMSLFEVGKVIDGTKCICPGASDLYRDLMYAFEKIFKNKSIIQKFRKLKKRKQQLFGKDLTDVKEIELHLSLVSKLDYWLVYELFLAIGWFNSIFPSWIRCQ